MLVIREFWRLILDLGQDRDNPPPLLPDTRTDGDEIEMEIIINKRDPAPTSPGYLKWVIFESRYPFTNGV